MASEIQSDRARKAEELKELQETYAKARKKAQAQGQDELEQVRSENHAAVEQEREAGRATINHINKSANQQIQEAKARGEERVTYEKEDIQRKFRTTREKGRNDIADMQAGIDEQKQALARTEDVIRRKLNEMEKTENEKTNHITQQEMSRRRKVSQLSNEEISSIQKKNLEDKEKVRQSQVTELRKMIEKHREQVEFMKKQQSDMIQKQKTLTGSQLRDREQSDAQRLETQRKQFAEREKDLRETARTQYDRQSKEAQTSLGELKKRNYDSLIDERNRGAEGVEKTREVYMKQVQQQEMDGDKELARQVEEHKQTLTKEDIAFRVQMDDRQNRHRVSQEELERHHRAEKDRTQVEYRKQLVEQKKEYDDIYSKNAKVFKDSLQDQHDRLTVALAKDKLAVTEDVGRYNDFKEDPFYRLTQTDAQVADDGHQYVLTATVPEHEQENVKVYVSGKKLIVQGHRKFDDQAQSEDRKVKTSTYQTYREEIPLNEPVMEKYVTRVWENGQLRVKLPKG